MSSTATVTPQAVTEWVRLFPRQITENYTSSVTFMKQLTAVAVSTISYLKNVFPKDSYTTETYGGIKLNILKQKCRDDMAQFVTSALTHAFEAIDKQYLHKLALCFYEDEYKLDNLVEYHIFEYTYNSDGVSINVHSQGRDQVPHSMKYAFENIREKTIRLIKACVVLMQACQGPLPDSYEICLKLYYNENAPEGYQAPGFVSSAEEHLEPTLGECQKLGSVETPFHRLTARTYIKLNEPSSTDAIPSQNPPMMTQNELGGITSPSTDERSLFDTSEMQLRCPCNKYDPDTHVTTLLTCHYCKRVGHAACFGISGEVARHCCAACADQDPARTPTDPTLATLTDKKRECLCIFRRTLKWCSQVQGLSARDMMDKYGISNVNAFKLMKLLHSHDVINQQPDADSLDNSHQIVHEQVKSVMRNFFQSEESKIVNRLLTETFSQGSQPDPLGDVLGPLQKASLHNATTLGRVIQPELKTTCIEDSTLKQYKEAILSNEPVDEELPWSDRNPLMDGDKIGRKRKMVATAERKKRSGVKPKRGTAN